jgi:histone-lysine N-methyltransferase SETMAR
MAAPLEARTRQEQRAVIRFLGSEGEKPADIHRRMKRQYGDACVSLQQVYEWHRKFKSGVSTLTDAARSGRPHTATTPNAIATVERVLRENRRVTIDKVAGELKISHGSAHHIIHDMLQYHKVSARWVPKQLIPELKERRVDVCEILLRRYEAEGDGFLHRIVTCDECWVHYFQPETKRASKEWRHSSSPKPKKFRTTRSAGKLMLTLFWDYKGPILEHYMPRELTINSESYCDLLQNHLKPVIRSKCRGLLSSDVLLQHDNARPHTARATANKITYLRLECISHPPYSPDLAPSDYHVFGSLEKFSTDDDIKEARSSQSEEFFSRGIQTLVKRWHVMGTMLRNDEVFSILFVHILLVKKNIVTF